MDGRPANYIRNARKIIGGGRRHVFGMGVPVADVIQSLFVVPENLLLFGGAMRPERETRAAVP